MEPEPQESLRAGQRAADDHALKMSAESNGNWAAACGTPGSLQMKARRKRRPYTEEMRWPRPEQLGE